MKPDLNELMKKAAEMQEKMQKAQVRRVNIDPSLMSEDKEILEDLIAAAMNDAVRKIEASSKDQMGGMLSGMGMPPGFKMPF